MRRAILLTATLVLGLVTVAPASAAEERSARAAAISSDRATGQDTDWGDGHGHGFGRVGPSNARTTTVNPASGPDFELPFRCGQTWQGSSRSGHSPSYYSIDFNASGDLGQPVLASAPGTVITARSLSGSYGRYVVVDHGNGFSTLYGHLDGIVATVGQVVDQGDLIGYLGSSGNSTGPHLHFEQRLNGAYFPPYFHRTTFRMNSTIASLNCNDRPVVGDWDGNGASEVGIYRTGASGGVFYKLLAGVTTTVAWGATADQPVVGDFDGDRISQVGVRRLTAGTWSLRSTNGAAATVTSVGSTSDRPLTGDWDGNGREGLGLYRWATSTFYLRADDGGYSATRFGRPGDRPVVGDWNGDGRADIGVFRPDAQRFYLRVPSGSSFATIGLAFGRGSDVPLAGDWNRDGRWEIGVWRPSTTRFYLRSTLTPADQTTSGVTYGIPRG